MGMIKAKLWSVIIVPNVCIRLLEIIWVLYNEQHNHIVYTPMQVIKINWWGSFHKRHVYKAIPIDPREIVSSDIFKANHHMHYNLDGY